MGITEDDISIEEASIRKESAISPEQCFVCRETNRSMMSYYLGRYSIGIIHWNNQAVFDAEVRLTRQIRINCQSYIADISFVIIELNMISRQKLRTGEEYRLILFMFL